MTSVFFLVIDKYSVAASIFSNSMVFYQSKSRISCVNGLYFFVYRWFTVTKLLTYHKCSICAPKLMQDDGEIFNETYSFMVEKAYESQACKHPSLPPLR